MGPKPPALLRVQRRRASPMRSRNGAEMPCKKRMVSIPRRITRTLRNQKKTKQMAGPDEKRAQEGASATIMALMASPPIQVWMPNQPQATRARGMAGEVGAREPDQRRGQKRKGGRRRA